MRFPTDSSYSTAETKDGEEKKHFRIEHVVFTSEQQSFSVIKALDADDVSVTLIGGLACLQEGLEIEAWGKWEKHSHYGRQFRVINYHPILPKTEAGIKSYLSSGVIPGIGAKMAERIVEMFGQETLLILDQYSARLLEVSGLGKHRLKKIREAWKSQTKRREQYIFLQGIGISPGLCERVFKRYGDNASVIISQNPYQLANDIKGVGFTMADDIARRLSIPKDHHQRLSSGVLYILQKQTEKEGHTCFEKKHIIEQGRVLLDVKTEMVEIGISQAKQDGAILEYNDTSNEQEIILQLTKFFELESQLAELIKVRINYEKLESTLSEKYSYGTSSQTLSEEQQQAVLAAFDHSISVITGGPGVGKTTVTRQIVTLGQQHNFRIALAAPTGRAAKRLTESSQLPAKTIHRLLKWDPRKQSFQYNEDQLLPVDIIIIDEVSMLDIPLAYHLFCALGIDTKIVLIGDQDQLPSVGPGAFLKDLITSNAIKITYLTKIYRQSTRSNIVTNAHDVNQGTLPDLQQKTPQEASDFYWIEEENPEKVNHLVCKMVSQRIPDRFGFLPMQDIQVLTPMNRGVCGTFYMNTCLQAWLNPEDKAKKDELQVGEIIFRVGDRVMQITNNYDLNVFNGDLGKIHHIDTEDGILQVCYESDIVSYDTDELDQLRLAYAMTVHKSQGSEFPVVIVPVLLQNSIMLRRNLLYTAMTRASRLLILIGSSKALYLAVKNYHQIPRRTRLANWITGAAPLL